VFSVLYALGDIFADVFWLADAFEAPRGTISDATLLAESTGVSAMIWGAGWLFAGLTAVWFSRRRL
jgi:hypothetical protein